MIDWVYNSNISFTKNYFTAKLCAALQLSLFKGIVHPVLNCGTSFFILQIYFQSPEHHKCITQEDYLTNYALFFWSHTIALCQTNLNDSFINQLIKLLSLTRIININLFLSQNYKMTQVELLIHLMVLLCSGFFLNIFFSLANKCHECDFYFDNSSTQLFWNHHLSTDGPICGLHSFIVNSV